MKIFKPIHDPNVKAVQFFRHNVKKLPKGLVQLVWSDRYSESFVKKAEHKDPSRQYKVDYVLADQNQYLNDGDWILENSSGYRHIEPHNFFIRQYEEIK